MVSDDGKRTLDKAHEELDKELPERIRKMVQWLRDPKRRLLRIPLGLVFLAGGCLWFLPILGAWMLPIGFALIAEDVPFLRKPVGNAVLWMVHQWRRLKSWREERKRRKAQAAAQT